MRARTCRTRRPIVAASVAVAIAASGLALWLAGGRGGRPPLLLSAIAFGIAVSGMHYTAMAGLTLFPHATPRRARRRCRPTCSRSWWRSSPSCVSGIFLLILVPDRGRACRPVAGRLASQPPRPAAPIGRRQEQSTVEPTGPGIYGPLGGAGGPPRRFARHLPVERDGATQFRRRRRRRRGPRQCPLHLHLRRHREAVLSARHRRRRIAARQPAASSACIAAISSISSASSAEARRRQRHGRAGRRPSAIRCRSAAAGSAG